MSRFGRSCSWRRPFSVGVTNFGQNRSQPRTFFAGPSELAVDVVCLREVMKDRQTMLPFDPHPDWSPVWRQLPERSRTSIVDLYARLIRQASRPRVQPQDQETLQEEKDAEQRSE